MHVDELRDTLADMAAKESVTSTGAATVVARGQRRLVRRRVSAAVVVLSVVGVAAGFAVNRGDARRGIEVGPTPTRPTAPAATVTSLPSVSVRATTPVPTALLPTTQTHVTGVSRVIFTSATEGWICADPVLHTADGGHTWQAAAWAQGAIATVPGFDPASATHTCDAVPTDAYLVAQSVSGQVLVVPIQGGSDPTGPVVLTGFPAGAVVTQVDFIDRDHGWILASADHGVTGRGLLYRTTTATGPFDPHLVSSAAPVGGIAFTDAQHGWGIAGAQVEQTTDGGATWRPVTVPTPAPVATELGNALEHVVARGAMVVVEGKNPSGSLNSTFFLVSSDGGATWTKRNGPPVTIGSTEVTMLEAVDATHWRFGFGLHLWFTDNGGQQWSSGGLPAGTVSIAFPAADTGFAIGSNGRLFEELEGGHAWYGDTPRTQPVWSSVLAPVPNGCPSAPVVEQAGQLDRAQQAVQAAEDFVLRARGWTGEDVLAVYPITQPAGQYGGLFLANVPRYCGTKVAASSYGVELGNPSITQDDSRSTALVVGHFADGWKVWGFYR